MSKRHTAAAILILLFSGLHVARAQQATELFIPIGQSPGLSGKHSLMGTIDAADEQNRTITITAPSGLYTIELTERTRIWLDRSKLKRRNLVGAAEDCKPGRVVEVKFENNERSDNGKADWIKVEITEHDP